MQSSLVFLVTEYSPVVFHNKLSVRENQIVVKELLLKIRKSWNGPSWVTEMGYRRTLLCII